MPVFLDIILIVLSVASERRGKIIILEEHYSCFNVVGTEASIKW